MSMLALVWLRQSLAVHQLLLEHSLLKMEISLLEMEISFMILWEIKWGTGLPKAHTKLRICVNYLKHSRMDKTDLR